VVRIPWRTVKPFATSSRKPCLTICSTCGAVASFEEQGIVSHAKLPWLLVLPILKSGSVTLLVANHRKFQRTNRSDCEISIRMDEIRNGKGCGGKSSSEDQHWT
jgi:hypothetical protein